MLEFMWILCCIVTVIVIIPVMIGLVKGEEGIIVPFVCISLVVCGIMWGAIGSGVIVRSESELVDCSILKTETAVVIECGGIRIIKEDIKTYNSVVNGKEKCSLVRSYNMYGRVIEKTINLINGEE